MEGKHGGVCILKIQAELKDEKELKEVFQNENDENGALSASINEEQGKQTYL